MNLPELEEWLIKKIEFHQKEGNASKEIEESTGKPERYASAGHYQRVIAYKNVLANIRQPNKSLYPTAQAIRQRSVG